MKWLLTIVTILSLGCGQGPIGTTGSKGSPGVDGRDGSNGVDGEDGKDGEDAYRLFDLVLPDKGLCVRIQGNLSVKQKGGLVVIYDNVGCADGKVCSLKAGQFCWIGLTFYSKLGNNENTVLRIINFNGGN